MNLENQNIFHHLLRNKHLLIILFSVLLIHSLPTSLIAGPDEKAISFQDENTLTCGWYEWDPYQYEDKSNNLTGLDIVLVNKIFENAGYQIKYRHIEWNEHQKDVKEGTTDLAAGAFYSKERDKYSYFCKPYRFERNSIYVLIKELQNFKFNTIGEILDEVKINNYKIGIVDGYRYTEQKLNDFIKEKENGPFLIKVKNEIDNFKNLKNSIVNIVITDRLAGAKIVWEEKWNKDIIEHPIKLDEKPIYILFSKKSDKINEETLERFNNSLDELKANGQYDNIIRKYIFPVLMSITVQRGWFYSIDIIGAVFFAIAGLMIAFDRKYDIFGVFVMVFSLAVGGGIIRDLFSNRKPLTILRSPDYIYIILIVSIAGFIFCLLHSYMDRKSKSYNNYMLKHVKKWQLIRLVIEALASGAYTIIGIGVAVEMQLTPLLLWGPILGCITSCGGGVIASTIRSDSKLSILKGDLYPENSLIWGFFFSCSLIWQTNRLNPDEVFIAVLITIAGITITQLMVRIFKITSLSINSE